MNSSLVRFPISHALICCLFHQRVIKHKFVLAIANPGGGLIVHQSTSLYLCISGLLNRDFFHLISFSQLTPGVQPLGYKSIESTIINNAVFSDIERRLFSADQVKERTFSEYFHFKYLKQFCISGICNTFRERARLLLGRFGRILFIYF